MRQHLMTKRICWILFEDGGKEKKVELDRCAQPVDANETKRELKRF